MQNIEIEKKYIIKKPSTELMRGMDNYSVSEIEQVYLKAPAGVTRRVRSRCTDGVYAYTETEKKRIDNMSAVETEREITEEEYEALLKLRREDSNAVIKSRHLFFYLGQPFEIDVYPAWERYCIMETELASRETEVNFPEFIEIYEDVTGRHEYSNAKMAREFPPEPQ